LVVVTHKGNKLPYQLHICPVAEATLELRNDEDATITLEEDRELETGIEDGPAILELDLTLELAGATLELAGATLEVTTPEQTAPDTTGTCALLLPLVPCTPNSTLEPTGILLFQFNGTAV
jgi:hypothetical protein